MNNQNKKCAIIQAYGERREIPNSATDFRKKDMWQMKQRKAQNKFFKEPEAMI